MENFFWNETETLIFPLRYLRFLKLVENRKNFGNVFIPENLKNKKCYTDLEKSRKPRKRWIRSITHFYVKEMIFITYFINDFMCFLSVQFYW